MGRARVALNAAVAPGQQYTFAFSVVAPASGSYSLQWQMMQRWVEWFGQTAANAVTVTASTGETVTYIHTDGLGSPVARSDAAGNVISRTRYEPYGLTAAGDVPSIGFTGHVNDAVTGLVYMQQRYYDAVAGRFLSIDPVTTDANSGASFNRYAYANNSPYKYIDPDGRDAVITSMRDGSIRIQIPIRFTGAGATPVNINSAKQDIQSKWSGTYTLNGSEKNVSVTVVDQRTDGKLNNITLTTGPTSNAGGASFVQGGRAGEWNTTSAGVAHGEMAHEGGHLMGAADHYSTSVGPDGQRATSPTEGFVGNLMGQLPGRPDSKNMTEIMANTANVKKVEPPEVVK
jgi:RHS repeat-associated protein